MKRWQWFVLLLLCATVVFEYLNFTGFCYGQGRYLSDKELIERAIGHRLSNVGEYYLSRGAKKYESVDDFTSANPNCCRLDRDGSHHFAVLIRRIFGRYFVSVELLYRFRDQGPKQFWYEYLFMDACGAVRDSAGHEQDAGAPVTDGGKGRP